MSLLRSLLAFVMLMALCVVSEAAQAGKDKKKDMSAPVRGVIASVVAAESGEGGSITIKTPAKKDKDATTIVLVNKDTKIEKAGANAKAGAGTPAKFSDLDKDVEVIVTIKEGMIGVADKVQIVSGSKKKE
jgi:hypothetical protein